jgi:hypothetical protein
VKVLCILGLFAFCLAGCGFLQRAGEAAKTPTASLGGKTPTQAAADAGARLLFNPTDPVAWALLIQSAVVVIAGGFAAKQIKKNKLKELAKT